MAKKVEKKSAKIEVPVETSSNRFELWVYDEYNQGSIVETGKDLDKLLVRAKKFVTDANLDNALASSERDKAWEAYFPVFVKKGKLDNTRLYAGNKKNGSHFYNEKDSSGKWSLKELSSFDDVRFLLGELSESGNLSNWLLKDHKSKELSSFNENVLERKSQLFIKVI